MRSRTRRATAAVLAAITVAVLTACAAIPTDGPVRSGGVLKDQSVSGLDFRPGKPVAGSDEATILRGFIAAGTGAADDYATARQYLASGFSEQWNPRSGVTILQGTPTVDRVGEQELTYTLTASATVDGDGEYTQAVRPTSTTLSFRFVRQRGEWRIAAAPDGIILSPVSFESVFQQHALYFFDPTYKFLVPDERWFLARSSTSTRIASALLAGPADWLKGAVVSSFPEGTQLSLNAVTVDSGTALVDLSSDALRANSQDRVRMREQLSRSLASVAAVSSVDITAEGAAFSVPASSGTDAQQNPDVDTRPLVDVDGAVGYAALGTGKVAVLGGGLGAEIGGLRPDSFALSASGAVAVVGNDDGVTVARQRSHLRIDATDGLAPPSVDDLGFAWVASRGSTKKVTAYGLGGDPHVVSTTLPSGRMVSFQVSRDSTRALALIETNDGPGLYVMAIVRRADRTPTSLGAPVRVQAAIGDAVGAAWISESDVASVAQTPSGPDVVRTTVGGQASTLPKPDGGATAIVGGSGGSMLLRTTDGAVLQSTGGGWESTGVTADVLGVQR